MSSAKKYTTCKLLLFDSSWLVMLFSYKYLMWFYIFLHLKDDTSGDEDHIDHIPIPPVVEVIIGNKY